VARKRWLLPLLLIPGLILLVLVVHVLLADGATTSKHERAETTLISAPLVSQGNDSLVENCGGDCGDDAAGDLLACVLALLLGFAVLLPIALLTKRAPESVRTFLVRVGSWRLPPSLELHELSVSRT
jgi:hypothetical protein